MLQPTNLFAQFSSEDKSKINHTLQVGDYFCADGKIVSVDAETVPENVIGIVCYVGNSQPSVTHTELYSAEVDALRRDFPACTHGMVDFTFIFDGIHFRRSSFQRTFSFIFHLTYSRISTLN